MSLFDEIKKVQEAFGKQLAEDLDKSLNAALKKGGSKNVQEAKLHFDENITTSQDGIVLQILASDLYWDWVDKGRKPGRMPPSDKLGRKWQNTQKIDPRKVLLEIEAKYKSKIKRKTNLSSKIRPRKKLSFDAAAKQLSFIIARSIGKKGYKARPYLSKILNDGRVEKLQEALSIVMGREINLELRLNNETVKVLL